MSRRLNRPVVSGVVAVLAAVLLWRAVAAEKKPPEPATPSQGVTNSLGGAERYLTYLSTDKPIYRPGETLFARGVTLHHRLRTPMIDGQQGRAAIEIRGPKGDIVASGMAQSQDSVLGFQWAIPSAQAGGQYTLKASYPWTGQPPAERKFEVRAYRAPRLKTQIKFLRDGYGAGDEVVAMLQAERAEGGVPANARVTVTARVDGTEVFRAPAVVDAKGYVQARFKLPAEIRRGEGTLALAIEDGGVVETASKTIPILLQTVDLTLYPEGGDLVAGLVNRVYFEAFTPAHKPADLAGVVLDAEGREVASFRSEHEGRGRFSFAPEKKGKYQLKITEPSGIKTLYPLPDVRGVGVVLTAMEEVTRKGLVVRLSLAATEADTYRVELRQRESLVASAAVRLSAGELQQVTLSADDADGILIATVLNSAAKPLAERLVFRQPAKEMKVRLSADSPRYVPGGKVKIAIKTTDANNKSLSAVVGLTVTDDSMLEMIDKREQSPRLPVMVLLENDVKELADAHVYFDASNQKAGLAVDLLLGTQGWRRFAVADSVRFAGAHGDAARRALAMRVVTTEERRTAETGRLRKDFAEKIRDGALAPDALAAGRPAARSAAAPKEAAPAAANGPHAADGPANNRLAQGKADAREPADNRPAEKQLADEKPAAAKPAADRAEAGDVANGGREFEERPADEFAKAPEGALAKALSKAANAEADRAFGGLGRRQGLRNDFPVMRVYAHQARSGRQPGERSDFAETLFWNAGVRTDERGEGTIEFGLSDAVTSFRVLADAFSVDGALGDASLAIESVEPLYVEPKLPLEVTMGDVIRLPVGIVNSTREALANGSLKYELRGVDVLHSGAVGVTLPADARVRHVLQLPVGSFIGEAQFTVAMKAGPYADKVTRKLSVRPLGFPAQFGYGGLVAADVSAKHEITIPGDVVPGSLKARLAVYPTPLANMTSALAALIQEPCGCFEQTSSTVYPLVMAQQYFKSHHGVDPSLIDRSSDVLQRGYERLLGFESKGGGFEWFGGDPGHDALTAYGLLEFTDMAQVRYVDPAMLSRTGEWLLSQRDGNGGYWRVANTLHTWVADPECAFAYNTWALLESGVKSDVSKEVKWVRDSAEKAQNTYAVALAANVLALAGDKEGESHLLDKLAGKQKEDGSLDGATTSVIGSGGEALQIETTALAVLAWLKNEHFAANVEKSIQYLAESCKNGRYGSTQSTVLALRAIVAYDRSRARPNAPGSLQLIVDGKEIGKPVAFDEHTTGAIELPAFAELLTAGKHDVQVRMAEGSRMPYSLAVDYHSLRPDSAKDCKLHLEVTLRDKKLDEGATTEAVAVVVNRTNEAVPTPVAIIGVPGGLEVRHDQLKELVKAGKIDAYEVLGREVVLYWRSLASEARVEVPLSLVAAVPGSYSAPASRAYLYYTGEHKQWDDGLKVEIEPKRQ